MVDNIVPLVAGLFVVLEQILTQVLRTSNNTKGNFRLLPSGGKFISGSLLYSFPGVD